jgi:hypothetical protein
MALPSFSRCFGIFCFETFLRSACPRWLCETLCSYAGYLGVSTLDTFKINILFQASSLKPLHVVCVSLGIIGY